MDGGAERSEPIANLIQTDGHAGLLTKIDGPVRGDDEWEME